MAEHEPAAWLLALRRSFAASVPKRLAAMEDLLGVWDGAKSEAEARRALTAIRDFAHNLAGSAGSFGFDRLGEAARELESLAESRVGAGAMDVEADRREVHRLAAKVRRAAEAGEA
jgi:HPt (histidine-containing phosphotransfer) domain-containing protein